MSPLLWVGLLLLLGFGVMILEVFIPSGGGLGFVSLAALCAAVGTAFLELGPVAGMAVLALVVVGVPVVLGFAFRWFPETPFGRRMLPPPPETADVVPHAIRRRRARDLVGHTGRTDGQLLPWGRVLFGTEPCEAVCESGAIDGGEVVEVVGVQGTAVVVRRVDPLSAAGPGEGGLAAETGVLPAEHRDTAAAEKPDPGTGVGLSATLETFEFEALNPPGA